MAITYPLSLPDTTSFAEIEFNPVNLVAVTQSQYSGEQQVQEQQGKFHTARVTIVPKAREAAAPWAAFFYSLKGQLGTFLLGDPHGATPQGSASSAPGTPLVNGASQTGNTLAIDGAPNSATNYLKADDWISLGSGSGTQLYKNLNDATTNGSGEVTLDVWPNLRSSPGDNDVVTVSNTLGLWRLAPGSGNYRIGRDHLYEFTFDIIEAI